MYAPNHGFLACCSSRGVYDFLCCIAGRRVGIHSFYNHMILSHARAAGLRAFTASIKARTAVPRHNISVMASSGGDAAAPQKVNMALCQLHVGSDKNANWDTARTAVKEAADNGAKLVVLPEMWNCPYSNDSFGPYSEDIDGGVSESAQLLSDAAKEHGVTLIGGSIPETSEGKLYNTCCVYGPDGTLLGKHRKVHLFDIDIPGKMTFKESETLSPGKHGTVVETPHGSVGIGICYDLRFPELAQLYAKKGAKIIVFPGAFNTTTGPLHWELLLRARATDNQLFVAACSPARNPDAKYQAWGHSTVVSPNAEVIGTTDHQPGIVYAELDLAEVDERRRNMPLRDQKRHDLYELVDKDT